MATTIHPNLHMCDVCGRDFRRLCDLNKHSKSHDRPWKCSELNCKFHKFGWATEKERDRHMNDRHSEDPTRFVCPECNYHSKRKSNVNQHRERYHGFRYVRSKRSPAASKPQEAKFPKPIHPSTWTGCHQNVDEIWCRPELCDYMGCSLPQYGTCPSFDFGGSRDLIEACTCLTPSQCVCYAIPTQLELPDLNIPVQCKEEDDEKKPLLPLFPVTWVSPNATMTQKSSPELASESSESSQSSIDRVPWSVTTDPVQQTLLESTDWSNTPTALQFDTSVEYGNVISPTGMFELPFGCMTETAEHFSFALD